MIQLTNKRELFEVTNQNESMKLIGQCTYSQDKRLVDSSFQVYDLQDTSYGYVTYSENLDETVSVQYMNVPSTLLDSVRDFLDTTVTAIKGELNK